MELNMSLSEIKIDCLTSMLNVWDFSLIWN